MARRKIRRWAASVLVAWLALSGLPLPARAAGIPDPAAIQRQMNAVQGQLRASQAKATQTRNQLAATRSQAASAQAKLNQLAAQLRSAQAELAQRRQQLARAQARLRQLRQALAANQARLVRQEQALGAGLRMTYENGVVSWLDVLLGARDFYDFVTRLHELMQIVQANVRLLRQVQAERRLVAAETEAQQRQVAQVASLTQQVAAAEQVLATRTAQQRVVYASYQQAAARLQAAYDEQEKESQAIQAQLARLERQYEAARGVNAHTGLTWPLTSFVVTRPFGRNYDPILHQVQMHTGIDLAAPEGTPVHAAGAGVVFFTGWMNGYGNTVILVHGNGLSTLYAHLSAILVHQGDAVEAGQVIGRVGETGWATGPHLHFEVRVDGVPQDPTKYVG
ncbi:MAG: peptidoglycan DD-metalloendopeptidase family protein [Bacillota bacterium]|nr:peptidoglycan DD-metalloendopeptidase family protein [Bacillota bacterium]